MVRCTDTAAVRHKLSLRLIQQTEKDRKRKAYYESFYTDEEEPYWILFCAIVNRAREDLLGSSADKYRAEIRDFFENGLVAALTGPDFGIWAYEAIEKESEEKRRKKHGVF